MRKERTERLPIMSLEPLVYLTEEKWTSQWQDSSFTTTFPKRVANADNIEGFKLLPDEDRIIVIQRAMQSFIGLPWGRSKESVAGNYYRLDKNLDIDPDIDRSKSAEGGEQLIKCVIGSIVLLGKTLGDKEYIDALIIEYYGKFNLEKKSRFRNEIIRLAQRDGNFRNVVKTQRLDAQNNFDWDADVARLFLKLQSFSLRYKIPVEFKEGIKFYDFGALSVFVDYAIENAETGERNLADFISRLNELDKDYFDDSPASIRLQEKIQNLMEVVGRK
ncbi:hypothetical protein HYT32_00530 [Candidatus Roizmanbacteria bacterium]|nr:hypothetical protein [Candidatus Roizmanbacteria bacterium]